MKLLLITVLCFSAAIAAPSLKFKRDILPGDPRYGTEYHQHHHHAHEHPQNEIEISRSAGGYVGTYSVPDTSYGPPNYQPGKPITADYLPPVSEPVVTPAPTYGFPAVHVPQPAPVVEVAKTSVPTHSYGPPAQVNIPQYVPSVEVSKTPVAVPAPSYAIPAVQEVQQAVHVPVASYGPPATSYGPPATSYGTPVVKSTVDNKSVSTEYGAPVVESVSKTIETPVTSYGTPAVVDVKAEEHVESVDTSYGIPAVQQIDAGSHVETSHVHTAVQKVAVPEVQVAPAVHHHAHVAQPQIKVNQHQHVQQANGGYVYNQQHSSHGYQHMSVPQVPSYTVQHEVHAPVQQEVRTPVVHQHVQEQKQFELPSFIQNLPNFQLPSFIQETFTNFQLPQLPSLPSFGGSSSVSAPVEIPTSIPNDSQNFRTSGVQQQYASNGGYVY